MQLHIVQIGQLSVLSPQFFAIFGEAQVRSLKVSLGAHGCWFWYISKVSPPYDLNYRDPS